MDAAYDNPDFWPNVIEDVVACERAFLELHQIDVEHYGPFLLQLRKHPHHDVHDAEDHDAATYDSGEYDTKNDEKDGGYYTQALIHLPVATRDIFQAVDIALSHILLEMAPLLTPSDWPYIISE